MKKSNKINPKYFLIILVLINVVFAGYTFREARFKNNKNYSAQKLFINNFEFNKWNGFDILEFKFDGVDAKIVFPQHPNKNKIGFGARNFGLMNHRLI